MNGSGFFLRGVEQALGGELAPALVEERHQRPDAGGLEPVDDDLVLGLAGEGGDLAGGDHLEPLLRPEAQAREGAAPDHRVDAGVGVLEAEIDVARAVRAAIARDLAAQADMAEIVLERAPQRLGEVGNRPFGRVRGRGGGLGEHRRLLE